MMISNNYLEDERQKLWKEVSIIKDELNTIKSDIRKRTPEYEAEAKQSSKKASEFRNRSQESKEAAELALSEIQKFKEYIEDLHEEISSKKQDISSVEASSKNALINIESFEEQSKNIETLFSKHDEYVRIISEINDLHSSGEKTVSKIGLLYSGITKKKKEIDDTHLEIFGFEEEDEETGEKKVVNGLKSDLEKSYENLKSNIQSTKVDLSELIKDNKVNNDKYTEEQANLISTKLNQWELEHQAASQKIKDLLPDAMTAGLSHAFSEKRKSEITFGNKLNRIFNWSILCLVIVSVIPFGINAYLLNIGKSLEDVITDMPRLLTAIIPLYIPLLWLAYSSNKKANLSKRLVEEYTHKEVLSKTFEGLSNQIESIEDESISSELRIKLLYNLLDVSAENPGKLISNYNTSDHPLIDALDKSSKLNASVTKLEKIPGMSKIMEILEKRSNKILVKQTEKIEETLDSLNS